MANLILTVAEDEDGQPYMGYERGMLWVECDVDISTSIGANGEAIPMDELPLSRIEECWIRGTTPSSSPGTFLNGFNLRFIDTGSFSPTSPALGICATKGVSAGAGGDYSNSNSYDTHRIRFYGYDV